MSKARARMYMRVEGDGPRKLNVWYAEVKDSRGNLVYKDNACGYLNMLSETEKAVFSVRTVELIGHRLSPVSDLAEEWDR